MAASTSKSCQFVHELVQFYRNRGQIGIQEKHLTPRLDGEEINLWDLYSTVLEFGGSFKVNHHSLWHEVYFRVFRKRPTGVNTSVALRQIYQRYLMPYERVNCSHFSHDVVDDDDDDQIMTTRGSSSSSSKDPLASFVIHSSLSTHHSFLSSSSQQQPSTGDPLSKLCCSLSSGLSNEVDFGLKIVQMLINKGQLDILADYKFTDILMECCALDVCFCDQEKRESSSLSSLLSNPSLLSSPPRKSSSSLPPSSPYAGASFFSTSPFKINPLSISSKSHLRSRLFTTRVQEKDDDEGQSSKIVPSSSLSGKNCLCFQRFWWQTSSDTSALNLVFEEEGRGNEESYCCSHPHPVDIEEKISFKVKRIADMIRSITEYIQETKDSQVFDESGELSPSLDFSPPLTLVKFVILLLSSKDTEMKSLGLDIASNISLYGNSSRDLELYVSLSNYICCRCISIIFDDNDIDGVIRALRTLGHLISASGDDFVKLFFDSFDSALLNRLIQLLTSQHDVLLVVSTLELMWSISEVKPKLLLSSPHSHLIKVLLNLINCDVPNHFTVEALRRIRMLDFRIRSQFNTPVNVVYTANAITNPSQPQQQQRIVVSNPTLAASLSNAPLNAPLSSTSLSHRTMVPVPIAPSSSPAVTAPFQIVQQPSIAESESFLINWLRTNYDIGAKGNIQTLNDLFTSYFKFSCQVGRKSVIGAQSFAFVLTKAFPNITINGQLVDGLVPRAIISNAVLQGTSNKSVTVTSVTPIPIQPKPPTMEQTQPQVTIATPITIAQIVQPSIQPPQVPQPVVTSSPSQNELNVPVSTNSSNPLTSPILKAHLSAPPKVSSSPPPSAVASPAAGTTLESSLATTTTAATPTSTLIKSLLANKLRNNTVSTKLDFGDSPIVTATETSVTTATATATIVKNDGVKLETPSITITPVTAATASPISSIPIPVLANSVSTGTASQGTFQVKTEPASPVQQPSPYSRTEVTISPVATNAATANASPSQQNSLSANTPNGPSTSTNLIIATSNASIMTSGTVSQPQQTFLTSMPTQSILISTPATTNASGAAVPQQFLLVRTIGAPGQPGVPQLVGVPSGGLRLVLPASVLTQQRPVPQNVNLPNGVVAVTGTNATVNSTVTTTTSSPEKTNHSNNSTNTNAGGDILLKAVLGSGIVPGTTEAASTNSSVADAGHNNAVKSSPLLNVLLDKGKLPDNVSPVVGASQISPNNSVAVTTTSSSVTTSPPQQPTQPQKVFILTKSPVPIKTAITSLVPENPTVGLKNGSVPDAVINNIISGQKSITVASAVTDPTQIAIGLTNGEVSESEKKTLPSLTTSNDLSPIKDIQRAMDDATKLISKRPNEESCTDGSESSSSPAKKKVKTEKDKKKKKGEKEKQVNHNDNEKKKKKSSPSKSPKTSDSPSSTPTKSLSSTDNSSPSTSLNGDVSSPQNSVSPVVNGPLSSASPAVISTQTSPPKLEYVCEWNGCKKIFPVATMVFKHVYEAHVFVDCTAKTAPTGVIAHCQWGGPDGMGPGCQSKRPMLSLLTHLQDFHCNPSLLHQTAVARQKLGAAPNVNLSITQPPPAHPGYAKNAALLAIRRHAVNYLEPVPSMPQTTTTPITVSIRLTAALILRNLALVSSDVRRCLQSHERYLSELCVIQGRDEARTIAQCLAIVQSSGWKR